MTRSNQHRRPLFSTVILLSACVFLSGCFQARPVALYTLSAETDVAPLSSVIPGDSVSIGPVTLAGYLDQPRMVRRSSPARIVTTADHQWAGDLAEMITSKLATEMGLLLKPATVSIPSNLTHGTARKRIAITILRFEDDDSHHAVLEARWTISAMESGVEGAPQLSILQEDLKSDSGEDLALALNRCLTRFGRELATAVANSQPLNKK